LRLVALTCTLTYGPEAADGSEIAVAVNIGIMQIAPALRSHAQNRFLRRLSNKTSANGDKGQPIPGALTPTEVAHKARRKARRISKLSNASKTIPFELERINTLLAKLEKETPKSSEEMRENADRVTHLLVSSDILVRQLKTANASLTRLLS